MENTKVDYPVTPIISNRQYYTFQLHCYITPSNSDTSNTNVFTKTILYVIDWLKQRMNFNSETCPENLSVLLKYPGIDEYKTFSISTDVNIKIKDSYNIDSIYIESAKNWSLRFKEQDNMSQFKHDDEIFYGRIFTTDICVRLEHQYTSLSVRTTCTEPTHNSQDCKVYRPKFIHSICNDSTLKTRELSIDCNDYDLLTEEPIRIDTNSKCNNLANNLIDNSERQLPILIFTSEQNSSYDISMIAKRLVAFCHLYIVSSNQFNRLMKARLQLEDLEQGDILIYRNKLSYDIIEQEFIDHTTQVYLIDSLSKYMIRKNISYQNSLFYKEAKIELFRDINSTDFASLLTFKENFDNTILEKDEQMQRIQNDLDGIQEEHRKQKKTIEDYDKLLEEAHNSNFEDTIKLGTYEHKITLLEHEKYILNELNTLLINIPDSKNEIIPWIEKNFSDQILVHTKAKTSMSKAKSQFKIRSLCSCIIYLNAYILFKRELISSEDLNIYDMNNHWNITSCGKHNVDKYPEYQINFCGNDGKYYNDYLFFHIRSGGDPRTLLRIYFSINDDLDKIIIGAMPDHLPTISGF